MMMLKVVFLRVTFFPPPPEKKRKDPLPQMSNIFVFSVEWHQNEVYIVGKTTEAHTMVYRIIGVYPTIVVNSTGNMTAFVSDLEIKLRTKIVSCEIVTGGRELVGYAEETFFEISVGNHETRSRIANLIDKEMWKPGVYVYNEGESPLLRFQLLHGIKCNRWYFISSPATTMATQFKCTALPTTPTPRLTMMTLAWTNTIACIVSDEDGGNQKPPQTFTSVRCLAEFVQKSDIDILVTHEGNTADLQKTKACGHTLSRIAGVNSVTNGIPGRIHVDVSKYNGLETTRRSSDSMDVYLTTTTTTGAISKCRAILQILSSNNVISSMFICSELSNLSPQRIVNTMISAKVEGALAEKMHELKIYKMSQASLSRKFGTQVIVDPATVKRAGGLQLDPVGGIYRLYSVLLDFTSMYPSIVIVNNLCYTTLDLSSSSSSSSSHAHTEKSYNSETGELVDLDPNEDGGLPLFTNKHRGFLPQIQEEFIAKRAAIRARVAHGKEQIDLDNAQQFYKLLGNSMIGVIGQSSSPFFLHKLYLTITRLGRSLLSQTVHWIKTYHADLKVVYGNTDSVFVSEFPTPEMAFEVGTRICSEISSAQLVLKLEAVLRNLVLVSKKKNRYLALNHDTGLAVIKGFEFVAKNSPSIFKTIGTELCSLALHGKDYTNRIEHYRNLFVSKRVNPALLISIVGNNATGQIHCRESLTPEELKFSLHDLSMLSRSCVVPASTIFDRSRSIDWDYYTARFETLVLSIRCDIFARKRPLQRPLAITNHGAVKCVFCSKGECVPAKWFGYCCPRCAVMPIPDLYTDLKKRLGELCLKQEEIFDLQCNVCVYPYPEFDIETCARHLCLFRGQRYILTKQIEHVRTRLRLVQCVCCLDPFDDDNEFIVPFNNGLKHKLCTDPKNEV